MKIVRHPNIVRLLEVCDGLHQFGPPFSTIWLICQALDLLELKSVFTTDFIFF